MDELAVTRFWMGGVISVMVVFALIAVAGHFRRKGGSDRDPGGSE